MSTTDTTEAGLRELTAAERQAVALYHGEEPIELIKIQTGLTRAQIAAAVDQARKLEDQPKAVAVAAPPRVVPVAPVAVRPKPAPVPRPTPVRAAGAPGSRENVEYWEIEDLLTWADEDGGTRPRSLAARARLIVKELRDLAGRGTAVREAENQLEKATAQLAAAKEALRIAKGQKPPTATQTAGGPSAAQIRTWAAENDIECPALGKVPGRIREAYDAARGQGDTP